MFMSPIFDSAGADRISTSDACWRQRSSALVSSISDPVHDVAQLRVARPFDEGDLLFPVLGP